MNKDGRECYWCGGNRFNTHKVRYTRLYDEDSENKEVDVCSRCGSIYSGKIRHQNIKYSIREDDSK